MTAYMMHIKWCPVCDGEHLDKATGLWVTHDNVPTGTVVMPWKCNCGNMGQVYEACFNAGLA